jgi:UDP-2-acetamido-3-amino-2,3-dideoxy-glucuronate N-acetyltransferase
MASTHVDRTLRVGVVGLGRWGGNLLRDLNNTARCRVDAICDLDPTVLSTRAAHYTGARPSTDVGDLITDPTLDAIVIATGGATHAGLARRALCAGKHVFVEKPPALRTEDARLLHELATRRGLRLMVGHLMQYHPAMAALADAVARGLFGPLEAVDTVRMIPVAGPADDDPWWSLGPHDVSVACLLFGGSPTHVSAHPLVGGGVRAALRFEGGRATLRVAFGSRTKVSRVRVEGPLAAARFDDVRSPALRLLRGEIAAPTHGSDSPLSLEVLHFVDGVLDGRPIRSDGADAIRVVEVLEAGAKSLASGGEVIAL